jgi:hypothetical protein
MKKIRQETLLQVLYIFNLSHVLGCLDFLHDVTDMKIYLESLGTEMAGPYNFGGY